MIQSLFQLKLLLRVSVPSWTSELSPFLKNSLKVRKPQKQLPVQGEEVCKNKTSPSTQMETTVVHLNVLLRSGPLKNHEQNLLQQFLIY